MILKIKFSMMPTKQFYKFYNNVNSCMSLSSKSKAELIEIIKQKDLHIDELIKYNDEFHATLSKLRSDSKKIEEIQNESKEIMGILSNLNGSVFENFSSIITNEDNFTKVMEQISPFLIT